MSPLPADPMILLDDVRLKLASAAGEVNVLNGVSLRVDPGETVSLVGPSGSGKSTLMMVIGGLERPSSGRVAVAGADFSRMSEDALARFRRDTVGIVFQNFHLVPTMTALENVVLPFTLGGRRPDRAWLDEVVDTVDLRDRLDHRPAELSGGQQQRVAVARALVTRPEIVFADEPTGNLDSRSGAEILGFLRRAVDRFDQTVAMVTHDPVAASYADAVVFLADGRVVDRMTEPTAARVLDRMRGFDRATELGA
jgi:putative ABC transport system ATP-binding protein